MFDHGLERVAELHRQDMLRAAELHRQVQLARGQTPSMRQQIGRYLVRVGTRLNGEPQGVPQLVSAGDAA